jgi:glutamate/tyrosine decarboxylase-like PLP-dependent enzyme
MNLMKLVSKLSWIGPKFGKFLEKRIRRIPAVRRQIDAQHDQMLEDLQQSLKPYRTEFETYSVLPSEGLDRQRILTELQTFASREESRWKDGFVSGAVYHGDPEFIDFLNRVYALYSQSNPLHSDLWPSLTKFEAEIVSMTANMLGAAKVEAPDDVVGTVSSGGTESILLAMKTYRDWALDTKGITKPELIIPVTAHAAFEKAAQYFGIKLIKVPVGPDFRADVEAMRKAINANTIAMAGSAPSFPHGVIDPIEELSYLAREKGIGFHTDACLGGFVLPWAERLGYEVPKFDFRLPGVTSMSVDTHKYGYAAKGTSVVLYRNPAFRHYQYYITSEWPGGLYFSPTFAGSRPGALSAVCWAGMISIGENGYLNATRAILETAEKIKTGIQEIPELRIMGEPLWVIAFASGELDIYQLMDRMTQKHWSLNGLHKPSCVHIALTLRHTQTGVAERFLEDLTEAVAYVKENPGESKGMAPVYGMAANIPFRGMVSDMLQKYLDLLYKP